MDNPWSNKPNASGGFIPPDPEWEKQFQLQLPEWLTPRLAEILLLAKLPVTKDGMLMLWQQTQERLKEIKELELEYRKICVNLLVPEKNEGMNTVELGNGYQAKAQVKFNYKLDPDNKKVWSCLEKIETLGNEGKFIAERLVSWTPNFLLTEYRQLQEDAEGGSQFAKDVLKVVSDMLTITDAAPGLEIKKPKEKKK